MAQLIIAAAGAAIGGALAPGVAFLGLTGASIGWTVGSLIGAQFGPTQRLKGPRLDDLKVTGVEYGQPIGWAAGHPRVAGQIWWASDKREIATTTEVGKGGGGAEVTSYTYEIDLLVGLLDRQIGGVSRVWANGKLVYTKLATSGTESALSSKSQTTWRRMTVYTGSETQLPDPTYETAVGVGYAPAYRDRGTVFIEGLQLGGSGQLPNLTFEVYMAGDEEGRAAQTLGTFAYTLGDDGGIPAMALPSFTHHIKGSTSTEILVYRYTLGLEEMELVTTYDMVASGNNPSYANSDVSGQFMVNIGSTAAYWYDDDGTGTSYTLPYNMNPATINVVFCRRDGVVLLGNVSKTAGDEKIYKGSSAGGTFSTSSAAMAEAVRSIAISGSNCYALNAPIGSADPTGIYVLDLATLTLQSTLTPPTGTDFRGQLITDENDYLYCFTGSTDEVYRLDGGSTWTLVKAITGGLEYGQAGTRLCMVGGDLWCITMPGGGDDAELRVVFDSVALADATVQDTVDELCTRAGMPAGTWSSTALSAITTPVRALVVAQVAPVRSVLEQLASAYAFDAYCADKLYFVPRGGAVAATPGTNDLGCGEEEAAAELLPVRVQEDASIPAQISLTYLNADADYNAATEHSDRLATDASNTATVQMPMAFTAAEAKTICDVMLADAYTGRIGGEATLPLAYSRHTPTDVLTLTDADGTTYRARVVRREQAGPVVKLEWVLDDTTALVSAGITSDDYTPSLTVALPGPTALTLLDIPILRDADDSAGIYAAAKPTGTVWPGAKLMTSVAGGDYTEAGSFTSRAVVGETTVALTSWTGGNVFDEGGSMRTCLKEVNAQFEAIRARLVAELPKAKVDVLCFGDNLFWHPSVSAAQHMPTLLLGYGRGMTSLFYATKEATQKAISFGKPCLVYLITDGEATDSDRNGASSAVAAALATNRITFACVGPAAASTFFKSCGIPDSCVRKWDGVDKTDLNKVTQQAAQGVSNYAQARSAGKTKMDSFFVDVVASAITPERVKKELRDITSSLRVRKINKFEVMKDYVETELKLTLVPGAGYYPLQKAEVLKQGRRIIVQIRGESHYYAGPAARKLLELPERRYVVHGVGDLAGDALPFAIFLQLIR